MKAHVEVKDEGIRNEGRGKGRGGKNKGQRGGVQIERSQMVDIRSKSQKKIFVYCSLKQGFKKKFLKYI